MNDRRARRTANHVARTYFLNWAEAKQWNAYSAIAAAANIAAKLGYRAAQRDARRKKGAKKR